MEFFMMQSFENLVDHKTQLFECVIHFYVRLKV